MDIYRFAQQGLDMTQFASKAPSMFFDVLYEYGKRKDVTTF